MTSLVTWVLTAGLLYVGVGLLFALVLLIKGFTTVDTQAKGSSLGFRLLMIPGILAFWPFLWRKWRKGS